MGNDTPDWGGRYIGQQFYPLDDMAELAARLGSLVTYDRRGSVIWMYGFDHGLGDTGAQGVSGGGVNLSKTYWEIPPFSAWLYTGASASSEASVERRMAIPQSLRVGFQVSLRFGTETDHVLVILEHYDGSTLYQTQLDIDTYNSRLRVLTSGSTWVTLDSALPDLSAGLYFTHAKIVVDLSDHTLVRALLDTDEYDLTDYAMAESADATAPHVRCKVLLENMEAVAALLYVDNLIITAAEP